jgi:hypothetical protein
MIRPASAERLASRQRGRMLRRPVVVLLFAAFTLAMLPVAAQPKTGTQFYAEYRAAYAKAKGFNDMTPWMSKAQKDKLAEIPPDQQKALWDINKQMDVKDLKVVKETPTANGAVLDVTGIGPQNTSFKGTVKLVKEGGAWKWDGEEIVM